MIIHTFCFNIKKCRFNTKINIYDLIISFFFYAYLGLCKKNISTILKTLKKGLLVVE